MVECMVARRGTIRTSNSEDLSPKRKSYQRNNTMKSYEKDNTIRNLLFVITFVFALSAVSMSKAEENTREEFEQKYTAWREYISSHPEFRLLSIAGPQFECPQFKEIVKIGPPALPHIVWKIEKNPDEQLLWRAIAEIAKVKIRVKYDEEKKMTVFPDFSTVKPGEDVYVHWWKTARQNTPKHFKKLYNEWQELKKQKKNEQAKEKYRKILHLGIAALPYMIEKAEQGDTELIAGISEFTDGKVRKDAPVSECLNWWEQNKEKWLIPFPNKKPVANAGQDQTVIAGDIVQLDGSASSDADKDELIYQWRQVAGPVVALSDSASVKPTFKTPVVDQKTVITFQLTVNDAKNSYPTPNSESEPVTVNITVNPK